MEQKLSVQLKKALGRRRKNIVFACIGTDRSTGDSLGPMVGTYLERMGYEVVGTLENPMHAVNLEERVSGIAKGKTIVAIDACLGTSVRIGAIVAERGPLRPGAGIGKDLPPVGDINIYGIVNVGGFMEYFVLQNTRLSLVMKMADEIVSAITEVLPTPALMEAAVAKQGRG